jgi:C4-type Zn-finger protein
MNCPVCQGHLEKKSKTQEIPKDRTRIRIMPILYCYYCHKCGYKTEWHT